MRNLISKLKNNNITIRLEDGNLKVASREGIEIDKSLIAELRLKKVEIIKFLESKDSYICDDIVSQEKKEYYELSSAQKRILFLQELDLKNIDYNISSLIQFDTVDEEKLEIALKKIVNRHEALRTSISYVNEIPKQIVHNDVTVIINHVEIDNNSLENYFQNIIKPFSLDQAPLFRVFLIKKDSGYFMFIDMHHIISDGISMEIILDDFKSIYSGNELVPLKLQYKDYSEWQQNPLQKRIILDQEKYWLTELDGDIPKISLPTDKKNEVPSNLSGGSVSTYLDTKLNDKLNKYCSENGVTLNMLVFSLFSILLSKISGQEEIVIGLSLNGRNQKNVNKIVGMFVNTLPIRCFPTQTKLFSSFIQEIKTSFLLAQDNQEYQFNSIVEKLVKKREIGHNPIFDVMYNSNNASNLIKDFANGFSKKFVHAADKKRFHITLNTTQYVNTIYLGFQYDANLFSKDTIEIFLRYFINIISVVDEFEEMKIGAIPLENREFVQSVKNELFTYEEKVSVLKLRNPASYHQERLYFIDEFEKGQLYKNAPIYHNIPLIIEFKGKTNTDILNQSIKAVLAKHEILRTFIENNDGELFQIVQNDFPIDMQILDVNEQTIQSEIDSQIDIPFKLSDVLVRSALLNVNENKQVFVCVFHHIIADRYSINRIAYELASSYKSIVDGRDNDIDDSYITYTNFSFWQKKSLRKLEPYYMSFWRHNLNGKIKVLEFPTDRPRKAIHVFKRGTANISIPNELFAQLTNFSTESETDLTIILLAAFKILLHKYCQQEEIIVGTEISNRIEVKNKILLGPASNLIPLRSKISENDCFNIIIEKLKGLFIESQPYWSMPFDKLVSELKPEMDMSRTALFDVVFNYEDSVLPLIELSGIEGKVIDTNLGYGKYDLNLFLQRNNVSIEGRLIYNSEYINHPRIERFIDHYYEILKNLITNPNKKVSEIELVTENEKQTLIYDSKNISVDYPKDKNIVQIFDEQVQRFPHKIAVKFENSCITYSELQKISVNLASILMQNGIESENIVGLLTERSVETIVGMFAILRVGAAYLPIDIDNPNTRINYIIKNSNAKVVLTTKVLSKEFDFDTPILLMDDRENIQLSNFKLKNNCSPSSLCYIIYTSGSTGNPKGVMVEHKNVIALLFNSEFQYDFSEKDIWTLFHNPCFDFSVWEIYGALLYGGELNIITKDKTKNMGEYLSTVIKNNVTILNKTPSVFYSILEELETKTNVSFSLRYVIFGGESLLPKRLAKWFKKYPHIKLINMYGITETTVHVTFKEIGENDIESNINNIGKPLPTATTYIFDKHMKFVPKGIIGELYVGGDTVSRGYINNKKLTKERFLQNPYKKDEILYKSGDLVKILENGELEYIGRIDNQVQVRGFRVELSEIEMHLLDHPKVIDAVVLVKEKNNDNFIVAYYKAENEIFELRQFLIDRLPEYMVPSYFQQVTSIPLTPNGKINVKELHKYEVKKSNLGVAPSSYIEKNLIKIWAEVLQIEDNLIGIDSNFFELGGHSLLANKIVIEIQKQVKYKVPLVDFYKNPTIKGLIESLSKKVKTKFLKIPRSEKKQYYVLSPSQKRFFYIQNLDVSNYKYNMPGLFPINNIKNSSLERAFNKLIEHHEILRTSFKTINNEPVQIINKSVEIGKIETYKVDDLVNINDALNQFIQPFVLDLAPLLRCALIELKDNSKYVCIDIHHIISDNSTQEILFNDLVSILSEKTLRDTHLKYTDYSEWINSKSQKDSYERQKEYWINEFKDGFVKLKFPNINSVSINSTAKGGREHFIIRDKQYNEIKNLVKISNSTINSLVFMVYNILLSKITGSNRILVATVVDIRNHSDLHGMLGPLINTVAIQTKLNDDLSFLDHLKNIHIKLSEVLDNQNYPFEDLVEDIEPKYGSLSAAIDAAFGMINNDTKFHNKEDNEKHVDLITQDTDYDEIARFNLSMNIIDNKNSFDCFIEYSLNFFNQETIHDLIEYFNKILSQIISDPNMKLRDIRILEDSNLKVEDTSYLEFEF